jgi:hypothetical protein
VVRVRISRVVQYATWLQYIRGISYREPNRKEEEEETYRKHLANGRIQLRHTNKHPANEMIGLRQKHKHPANGMIGLRHTSTLKTEGYD